MEKNKFGKIGQLIAAYNNNVETPIYMEIVIEIDFKLVKYFNVLNGKYGVADVDQYESWWQYSKVDNIVVTSET